MRISSHTRYENHNISGFSLMLIGWKVLFCQIAAEPLMSSHWPKRVWLAVRNKTRPFQVQFFCYSLSSGWYSPFLRASHRIHWHLAQGVESIPERALCSHAGSVLREQFSSSSTSLSLSPSLSLPLSLFCSNERTAFKGYCLPTSCKKHTGTGSSSPKRARCSGVVGSSSLPLQARFHSLSV